MSSEPNIFNRFFRRTIGRSSKAFSRTKAMSKSNSTPEDPLNISSTSKSTKIPSESMNNNEEDQTECNFGSTKTVSTEPDYELKSRQLMELLKIPQPEEDRTSETESDTEEEEEVVEEKQEKKEDVKEIIRSILEKKISSPTWQPRRLPQLKAYPQVQQVRVPIHPILSADGLHWYSDLPSPGVGSILRDYKEKVFPLTWPIHINQGTGSVHVYFDQPIDYLISWTGECMACGYVKRFEDATENVPLCIRFGGFWSPQALKSMYVGCTVRVRAYLELTNDVFRNEIEPIVPRGAGIEGYIAVGVPRPSAFALEWAVVSRPRIIRSLGLLKEDVSFEHKKRLHLLGKVRDVEYKEDLTVCHEKWPVPEMKCLPCPPYPVVVNWIEISEQVILQPTRNKTLVMPAYIHHYMRTKEPVAYCCVFGWVDLGMEPSRVFDKY